MHRERARERHVGAVVGVRPAHSDEALLERLQTGAATGGRPEVELAAGPGLAQLSRRCIE